MQAYQLDPNRLLPGDVLLERGRGLESAIIRVFDWGSFSHAILYLGGGQIIEAVDRGVSLRSALYVICTDPSRFALLRHPDGRGRIEPKIEFLHAFAQGEMNKLYSTEGAIGTKIPFFRRRADEHFCSELIALIYQRMDIQLFTDKRHPDRVAPNDFARPSCTLVRQREAPFRDLPPLPSNLPNDVFLSLVDRDRLHSMSLSGMAGDLAQKAVAKYAGELEDAAKAKNIPAKVASLSDIYWMLFIPDLPNADRISEELKAMLEDSEVRQRIASVEDTYKAEVDYRLASNNPILRSYVIRSLEDSISASADVLRLYAEQVFYMHKLMEGDIAPPPIFASLGALKVRSIHRWVLEVAKDAIARELGLLQWQKETIKRIS
jgi:hypothetical protein